MMVPLYIYIYMDKFQVVEKTVDVERTGYENGHCHFHASWIRFRYLVQCFFHYQATQLVLAYLEVGSKIDSDECTACFVVMMVLLPSLSGIYFEH